jgi:hypothetical protein
VTPRTEHDCRHCGYPLSEAAIAAGNALCAQCSGWCDKNMGVINSLPLSARQVQRPEHRNVRRVGR